MSSIFDDSAKTLIEGANALAKGAASFNQSMGELAQNKAYGDANDKLSALNQQAAQENWSKEKLLQAQSAVGQSLAMRLGAAGASPEQIMATANRLAPSGSEQFQDLANKETQKQAQNFEINQKMPFQRQSAEELARIKGEYMLRASGMKSSKQATDTMDKFEKRPDIQPILKSMPELDRALDTINNAQGKPLGAELAKMGILKAAVGRVNEREFIAADSTPDAKTALARKFNIQVTGQDLQSNTAFWTKFVTGVKQNAVDKLGRAADAHADSVSKANPGLDADALKSAFKSRYSYMSAKAQGPIQTITPPQGIRSGGAGAPQALPPGVRFGP